MSEDCVDDLMREYRHYDQCVDIVSVFEMLFTESQTLPATVTHFARYPKVDGYTPDFTVVFADGTGLVGEIANVPRDDRGRDKTCSQLANYDSLTHLPIDSDGTVQRVSQLDVLFLTPLSDANEVANHILTDRMNNPDHPYSPSHPPCVVGYTLEQRESGPSYLLLRVGHSENGELREDDRSDGIGAWWKGGRSVKVPPGLIEDTKARSVFMNDPVKPLYMVVALWARALPTLAPKSPRRPEPIDVSESQLVTLLRERYGRGTFDDVRSALELLEKSKYAVRFSANGDWRIAWEQPRNGATENLAQQFADRVCNPRQRGAVHRLPRPKPEEKADSAEQLRFDA